MRLLSLFCLLLPISLLAQSYTPGTLYSSPDSLITYQAGNIPLILSVPHGGYLRPDSIPDRDCSGCVYVRDAYTQELSQWINEQLIAMTGCYPHVITNLLDRRKLDANRSLTTATSGNVEAEPAWYAYHDFIDSAKQSILRDFGKGLFIDLHGHGHEIQRLELGYLLRDTVLRKGDDFLNMPSTVELSSIRSLVLNHPEGSSHADLLRGPLSLGQQLEGRTYPSVPSADDPAPMEGDPYFRGGYNTARHGSRDSGAIDAIQIECNQAVRFEEEERERFGDSLAIVLWGYLEHHYFSDLSTCLTTSNSSIIDHKIVVYPNPILDRFYVKVAEGPVYLKVVDQWGRVREDRVVGVGEVEIGVKDWEAGVYWVGLWGEGRLLGWRRVVKL